MGHFSRGGSDAVGSITLALVAAPTNAGAQQHISVLASHRAGSLSFALPKEILLDPCLVYSADI